MVYNAKQTDRLTVLPLGPGGSSIPGVITQDVPVSQLTGGVGAQYSAATNTTGFTATTAQIEGGEFVVIQLTGTLGAGAAITTPTGAQMIAALPNANIGLGYVLRIINSSSANFAWTLTAGASGVTINGTATIAQNTWRDFVVTMSSATAITIQSVGTGTNS